jgi:hypothetical protein
MGNSWIGVRNKNLTDAYNGTAVLESASQILTGPTEDQDFGIKGTLVRVGSNEVGLSTFEHYWLLELFAL